MPRVSIAFFVFAALCGLTGMGWGIWMGMAENHQTLTAHAHLNLIGWVSCALMGGFYALVKERAGSKLAWMNFGLVSGGVVVMIPSLAAMMSGVDLPGILPAAILGSIAVFVGMATFTINVLIAAMCANQPVQA
ncbi:MAG: hypothetical protein EON61_24145 [Alphaproteobacteria bacterium]|nr:MAG: hypothetical protein EON61_24145 [Alphaproteobacteria bacterium]